jgi:NADPH:quinone reductase
MGRKTLLVCGILAAFLYIAMTLVVGVVWAGYSSADQTISELSAIGAPTRPLWMLLGTVYSVLMVAFGWIVWKSALPNHALRVVGALIMAHSLFGYFWPPMHQRAVLAAGGGTLTDTLHLAWAIVNGLLFLLAVGFGAAAFEKRFRVYSIATLVILLACGAWNGTYASAIQANMPTPWAGVWERITSTAYMVWVAVLATRLLRTRDTAVVTSRRDAAVARDGYPRVEEHGVGAAPFRSRRVVVTRYGGPEVLQVVDENPPEPRAGEARVRILAAGVSYADLLMREGVHPEAPRPPFTLGWDLVGVVDRLGAGVEGLALNQRVAALSITGGCADYICLPAPELVPVPSYVDLAEAAALVMNYVTAYQMLHRSARVQPGQRALIHGAAGGIGTALLELGRLSHLRMYGTARQAAQGAIANLGGTPIDFEHADFVNEVQRITGDGVDVVFDGIGGTHVWRSFRTLRRGGTVVAYGLTSTLRGGTLARGSRHRLRGVPIIGLLMMAARLVPGRKKILLYRACSN